MVTVNAMKRRVKNPPEAVGGFLKSLQSQGLSNKQIGNLAQKQSDPEAWRNRFKSIVAKNQAQGGASAFSGATSSTPRRGSADYKGSNSPYNLSGAFSKDNPGSLPNRAANAAGDVGHAAGAIGRRLKKFKY